jgi:hypothetical protein
MNLSSTSPNSAQLWKQIKPFSETFHRHAQTVKAFRSVLGQKLHQLSFLISVFSNAVE